MSYVNFNRANTKNQIEALNDATNGKIYFGTDGGIYVGNSNGTADKKADLNVSIPFAQVDATSTATVFTATVPGITQLKDGTCVMLYNGVVTSAAGCTLNINGLGAKPFFSNLTANTRDTTIFNVAYTMLFVYDSTRVVDGITGAWCCYRGYDANTNTIGYQVRTNSMSLPMTSITYRYRILFTSADGKHFVPANNSTSTNATASRSVCQDPIDPFGWIVYYGTTASVAAGSQPSATNLWSQYALSLGYSFNRTGAALTLTSWKPVYVKCAPQANGSAIIDSTTPYVQDLPTTEDGKIYIYLGNAYGPTSIELVPVHPVYYYKDGAIRLWTNNSAAPTPDMASRSDEVGYIDHKVGGFKVLVDNDDIELNLSGTHTALDDFDFTFTQLTTAGCPQYAIDIMKYEPVTIWFYDSNESKVAEGETLYADDIEENGVSIVLHSDTTFTYASAVILNLANTSTYEGGNEIYYHIIKLPYNYLDTTNSITDGDYHPVTSNAVYDALLGLATDVEVKSNKVTSISSSSTDTQYPSAKCTYDSINPAVGTSQGTGMVPNKMYNLGTLTGSVTFTLASPTDNNIVNHYYWTFDTSSTAPTITWPAGISWNGGSAPTINASKHYEISVLNSIGSFMEV